MSVGLNILIRHSFMDLWFWITALVPWPQLLHRIKHKATKIRTNETIALERSVEYTTGGLSQPKRTDIFSDFSLKTYVVGAH